MMYYKVNFSYAPSEVECLIMIAKNEKDIFIQIKNNYLFDERYSFSKVGLGGEGITDRINKIIFYSIEKIKLSQLDKSRIIYVGNYSF